MTLSSVLTSTILVTSSSSSSSVSNNKGKKRARFVDENEDDRRDQIPRRQVLANKETHSMILKTNEDAFDHLDASDNENLCRGMYQTFLDTAFTERSNGQLDRYEQFLEQFQHLTSPSSSTSQPTPSIPRIQRWLTTLTSMVSKLDRTHSSLVTRVLSLPWAVMDDEFVAIYSRFVNGLVSARSEWVHLVVEKIVKGMQYRSVPLEVRSSLLRTEVTRRVIYQRLHSLLRSVLRLVPTLPSILWPILEHNYPNKRESRDAHICYTANLLKITTYCDELMEHIIKLAIDRCVKLDVEIQVEVEDWEDEDGRLEAEIFDKSVNDAFDKSWADEDEEVEDDDLNDDEEGLDLDDLSSDDDPDSSDDDHPTVTTPPTAAIRKVKELAAKLDATLRCVLDHLQYMSFGVSFKQPPPSGTFDQMLDSSSSLQSNDPMGDPHLRAQRELFFDILLSTFESSILRTHRTRHTQFIIFWYASVHPTFADSLLATLVECALYGHHDSTYPIVTRVASLGYIASLISRARYIDQQTTRHVVSLLCARLEAGLVGEGNANSYALWYSIAQALFYIFCFRWKDLLAGEDEDMDEGDSLGVVKHVSRWLGGLKVLERAVSSHLNPLKACAPTVVAQFAKVAHQTNFIYCYNILSANDRSTINPKLPLPSTPSNLQKLPPMTSDPVVRQVLSESRMDSFFPFDPCRLPLTLPYIEKIYRVWEGAPGDVEENEDDEDEDEDIDVD